MLKLDKELIKDRFSATSYSFYTDDEIKRLSVKQILNPTAFDHLGKPLSGGIYDKTLGVSPFDKRSNCVTCGLDCQYCPGHVGHIELTAPVYNPFLVTQLYKLLKSKCIKCHHLRINPNKIDVYVMCLKLIKSGQVVASETIKSHFLFAAKDIKLLSDQEILDPKKLDTLKARLDSLIAPTKIEPIVAEDGDNLTYFKRLDRTFRNMKQEHGEKLREIFTEFTTHNAEEYNFQACHTSIMQRALKDLIQEIWGSIIPTNCPHCQAKSPGFRKDGATKIFQKAFSDKMRNQIMQSERISKADSVKSRAESIDAKDDTLENTTNASTRKLSSNMDAQSDHIGADQTDNDEDQEDDTGNTVQNLMTQIEVKDHIEKLWAKDKEILDLIFGRYYPEIDGEPYVSDSLGPQMFFINKLLVPPNRFRPESQGGLGGGSSQGDKSFLHAHSAMLSKILVINLAMKDALLAQHNGDLPVVVHGREKSFGGEIIQKWMQLQEAINTFMDSSLAQKTADREQNGLRQLLERKEGMFRMKMMGKRVNYGARSVISPDPYITTDQIGVPLFVAKKLTFPESVSAVNVQRLRQAVINGSKQHPGANIVEDEETGDRINLEVLNIDQRRGLAYQLAVGKKIVYRHLHNGDPLLVNRQPTLHKPSIMAHIARVLPKEQTIRMHYANCNTYNADFDGDEMNLHLPQSYLACSEAYKLMATHKQYIVPTSGKPIRGLIQDSVVSGVFLSSKDTFLTKEQYQQLVYVGLRELLEDDKLGKIVTMTPTIIKPHPMWTGKQAISTILRNIVNQDSRIYKLNKITGLNLDAKSKLSAKEWGPIGKEEGDIVIRDNELLQGTLDKNQYGASEFGMVHSFYEIYGSEKAGELLTALARIFAAFLQERGFSCGLDDLVLTPEYNKNRRLIIEESHKNGMQAAAEFSGLKDFQAEKFNYSNRIVFQGKDKPKDKDIEKYNKIALPANPFEGKKCVQVNDPVRNALEMKFNSSEDVNKLDVELDNTMKSKMNKATENIINGCVPDGLVKRFPRNSISAMVLTGAKGGLVNMTQICCLLGQQELEGRRVPKMQNGKTLPCYLPYDPNPRSSGYVTDRFISGLRPQDFYFHCMAGREGLIDTAVKTSRSGYLQRCLIKQLESLIVSYDLTVRDNDGSIVQFLYGDDSIDVMNSKYLDRFQFLESNFSSLITNYNGQEIMSRVDNDSAALYKQNERRAMKRVRKQIPGISRAELYKNHRADPVISQYHPLKYFGAISEKMETQLKQYIENDSTAQIVEAQGASAPKSLFKPILGETFRKTYYLKYMKSIVHPGENVGTIAGQSIGEPSTQMTLNTFHLAGHGAENMTLGIPRLKEILMTTPVNIKTPNMQVYFQKEKLETMTRQDMEKFAYQFKRIRLSDVTKEIKVSQYIGADGTGFSRFYKITLIFESFERIDKFLGLTFEELLKVFSDKFATLLLSEIQKQMKKAGPTTQGDHHEESNAKSGGKKGVKKDSVEEKKSSEDMIELEEIAIVKQGKKKQQRNKEEGDEEDDEESVDDNNEIDGVQKKSKEYNGYDQQEEEEKEEPPNEVVDDDILQSHCNVFKEKFSKYLNIIKSITHELNKSVTLEVSYNLSDKKILMLTLAETLLSKVLVRSVAGIDKCILIAQDPSKEGTVDKKEPYLLVQGLNFDAFAKDSDTVNMNRLASNDIFKIGKKYGVEAMRASLVNEVRSVFKMYGIEVNYRHLSLIGDFMTFNGKYRAFNRIGMEESSSPFLKMSFETTMKYLVGSCLTKDTDDMSTPSSALVLGQVPRVGTGIFDVMHDFDFQSNANA